MNKETKFYKVTAKIVKNYDKQKDLSDAEIAREHNVPSGVVSHIRRTIYITRGEK